MTTVDIYDTLRDSWQTGIPMGKKRQYFSAVTFNNCIYVIGGDSADHPTMEKFDIEQQVWEDMGSVPSNGFYHSVEIQKDTGL
ncbi:unnamed protein product [Allacma fusca]|uniref:Uncharacterized protein n=1 Tax=Allacma fusca TaxID=39272 RepID=A0A8J2KUK4_9HEXA|nr:unnamed protein product [Allacma fusca]